MAIIVIAFSYLSNKSIIFFPLVCLLQTYLKKSLLMQSSYFVDCLHSVVLPLWQILRLPSCPMDLLSSQ